MEKRKVGRLFAVLVILVLAFTALAACTPTEEDHSAEYLGNLSTALANTIAMNPEKGFLFDLGANVAFKFKDSEKSQYDWSYGLAVKGNVFVDGETKQGLGIELRDTSGVDNPEAATLGVGGGDLLFGLYNTPSEDLYLTIRGVGDYRFSNVAVFNAIKTMLKANGVDLDFDLGDLEIMEGSTISDLVSGVLPILESVFDDVQQDGNDYLVKLKFSKLWELVGGLLETSGIKLPAEVTDLLPKELDLNVIIYTDGKVIVGADVVNATLESKNGADDGTFDMKARFHLFGEAADQVDVDAVVPETLKALTATKVLNMDAHGEIRFEAFKEANEEEGTEAGTVVTRTMNWTLKADFDLFRALEKNFVLDDEIFADNTLYFELRMDGIPIIDLVFDPEEFETNDLIVGLNSKVLLDTIMPGKNVFGKTLGNFVATYVGENLFVALDSTVLGYMISGAGAPIVPDGGDTPEVPDGGGSTGGTSIDIMALLPKLIGAISVDNGLAIELNEILGALGLDQSVTDIVNNLTNQGDTVRFANTALNYGSFDASTLVIRDELKKGTYNPETDTYADRVFTIGTKKFAPVVNYEVETNDGFLQLYNTAGTAQSVYDKTIRMTLEELNSYISNTQIAVRWSGTDILGNEVNKAGGATAVAPITGYLGLDPTKIGVQQTVTFLVGMPDSGGLLTLFGSMGGILSNALDMDLTPIIDILFGLKFQSFEADIILSEAERDVKIFERVKITNETTGKDEYITGKELCEDGALNLLTVGKTADYKVIGTTKYFANASFAEDEIITDEKTSLKQDISLSLVYQPLQFNRLYLTETPLYDITVNGEAHMNGIGEVTVPFMYRGKIVKKTYVFESLSDVTFNAVENKSLKVGDSVAYNTLGNYFTLSGVYKKVGEEDVTVEIKLASTAIKNTATVKFENVSDLTNSDLAKFDAKISDKFTVTSAGTAKIVVSFHGVEVVVGELTVTDPAAETPEAA